EEGVVVGHGVGEASTCSKEGVAAARCGGCPRPHPREQVIATSVAQNPRPAEVELRCRINDIARQRAARCAVAADVEVAGSLLTGSVLHIVGAGRRHARHRYRPGDGAATDALNLTTGDAVDTGHREAVSARRIEALDGIRSRGHWLAWFEGGEGPGTR